jgi:malate/lactate dehydrogenase
MWAAQVALLGAAGGIGQPLGLLLKMNKYISELSLYDIAPSTPGVAKDLSHCNTPSTVRLLLRSPALEVAFDTNPKLDVCKLSRDG